MFNLSEPTKREVELWWQAKDYPDQLDLIDSVYPDCDLGAAEGWKYLDWTLKLELYLEEQ